MMYGPPSQYMGVSLKAVYPLLILTVVLVVLPIISVVVDNKDPDYVAATSEMKALSDARIDETGPFVYFMAGVFGFFVLANSPAVLAPAMALESYFASESSKFTQMKMAELMRINANSWVFQAVANLGSMMMAPDLSIYGPMWFVFNMYFAGLFVFNIVNAADYGFKVPPMLFFLVVVTFSSGGLLVGLLMS